MGEAKLKGTTIVSVVEELARLSDRELEVLTILARQEDFDRRGQSVLKPLKRFIGLKVDKLEDRG